MIPVPIIQGDLLTTTVRPYYSVAAGNNKMKSLHLTSMRFCNTTASDVLVSVYVVPSGSVPADQYLRFSDLKVLANTQRDPSAFFAMDEVMLPGTTIHAIANANNAVAFSAFGVQYP